MADTVEFERRKRKRGRGYTAIDNKLFDDDRLQADEQGLMGYLISRPPGWVVNRHQLGVRYGFGREAMQRIIWKLASTGWLGIVRHRHPQTGTVHTRLIINEVPGPEMTVEAVTSTRASARIVRSSSVTVCLGAENAGGFLPGVPCSAMPAFWQAARGGGRGC